MDIVQSTSWYLDDKRIDEMRKFEVYTHKGNPLHPVVLLGDSISYGCPGRVVYVYKGTGYGRMLSSVVDDVEYFTEDHDYDDDRKKCTDCRCQGS